MARNSKISFVSVGVASQELVGGSNNRVGLLIFGGTAGRVTISNDSPVVLDNGATFVQSATPIQLWREQAGGVVNAPFFAIAAVAGTVVGIIEVLEG